MADAHKVASTKLRLLALIPVLGLLGAVVVGAVGARPGTLDWAGFSLIQPIVSAKAYQAEDRVLFETRQRVAVRAAIAGTVCLISGRVLEIRATTVTIRYIGITSPSVNDHQEVRAGESLGYIEPGHPDPFVATLYLRLLRDDKPVNPPDFLARRFRDLGQQIAAQSCIGCHQMREVFPLDDKRMMNGSDATAQSVEATIRQGGMVKGPLGMPAFQGILSDQEIKAVVAFMCETRCVPKMAAIR